jgi:hypothetical protein
LTEIFGGEQWHANTKFDEMPRASIDTDSALRATRSAPTALSAMDAMEVENPCTC